MLPEAAVLTGEVVTGNVALVEPCGTVMLAGTVTPGTLLESLSETPPALAGLARVTVPVAGWPPTIVGGSILTPTTAPAPGVPAAVAGFTVIGAVREFALAAVMLAVTAVLTGVVLIGKAAVKAPGVTVTKLGTVTLGSVLAITADTPLGPAGLARVMVPVAD
jgi:hypothetical protein